MKHPIPATGEYFRRRVTFPSDFHSVVLEGLQGNRLVDTLDLFGFGVDLLFTLLTTTTKTQNKMKCRFFLNVVVTQCTAIFKLFSGKDQTLLIRRNTFLVLNLGLDIVNGVGRLNIERNGLACI